MPAATLRAVSAAVAHRCDAGDELGLSDWPHFLGTTRAVHGMALQEHRGNDVVAAAEIGEQIL